MPSWALAALAFLVISGATHLRASDDASVDTGGTAALTRPSLQAALQDGDAYTLAATLHLLRFGNSGMEPIEWLSIRSEDVDHNKRRYPNAERLGRWLGNFDAAVESVAPEDPESLARAIVEQLASMQGTVSGSRSRDDQLLLDDIASGRIGLSRAVDLLATRDATVSDLEVAIAHGRRSADVQ